MKRQTVKKTPVLLILLILFSVCAAGCQSVWRPGTPLNKEKLKIGVIYIDNAQSGYSYGHDIGIQEMQRDLGLGDDQIIRKLNVDGADTGMMAESAIRDCIAEGANVILATSWGFMDVCERLAGEYPNVVFAHASGYKSNDTNFTNYFGRIYQARYISGVAAGLKTRSNKLGYVAAMDKSNSEVTGGLNAFALGVESVNPDAKIYVSVTHSWFDPAGEREAAAALIEDGCDVIAQHCDTPMPQIEAEETGVFGIGYNSDMSREAPNAVITSVIWHWGVYYTALIQSVIDGSFTTTPYYGGLGAGMVDITPLNGALITPDMEAAVLDAKERIMSGECGVFDGVMETNDGQTVGAAEGTLSDAEITGGMNWYYRNIVAE